MPDGLQAGAHRPEGRNPRPPDRARQTALASCRSRNAMESSSAMSDLWVIPAVIAVDRRQSPTALAVARGTQRLLRALGLSCVSEMPLMSGRRADLIALGGDGEIWIVEIKSSVEDFRADQKWIDYRMHCDRLFFATAATVPLNIFPEDAGLILADAYGAELVREAPEHRLHAATRKSVTLAFARAASVRLQALHDPQGPYDREY
jgi:hypothetical protein